MVGCRLDHKDLILWQRALDLCVAVHQLTDELPRAERFGLIAQLRRAATSIPSNIAEGSARRTTREFLAFLYVARGSLAEVDTQLLLAVRLCFLDRTRLVQLQPSMDEVGRLLNAVISGLKARVRP